MPDCARSAAGPGRVSAYTTTRNANHILQSRMYTAQIGPLGCAPTPGPKEQSLLRSKRLFTCAARGAVLPGTLALNGGTTGLGGAYCQGEHGLPRASANSPRCTASQCKAAHAAARAAAVAASSRRPTLHPSSCTRPRRPPPSAPLVATLSPPPPVAPLAATVIAPAVVLCVAVVVRTAQCLALGRWGAVAGARSVYTVVSPVYTVVR